MRAPPNNPKPNLEPPAKVVENNLADETFLLDQSLRRIAGNAARLGGWAIDLANMKLFWSDEVCVIHDLPPGYQPTLEEGLDFFPAHVQYKVRRHLQDCIDHGTAYDLELPKLTATGRKIIVRSIGEAVRDEQGRIIRVQGAFQDITTQKQIEEQLFKQAAMLDNARDAMTATDINWRITYWNKSAERLYGWPASQAIGSFLHELLKVDVELVKEYQNELFTNGVWNGDIVKTTKDNRRLIIHVSWTLMGDDAKQPTSIFTIDTDVTQQRGLEEQLRQSQKMEAIGVLAGGIAHDFNNLLMVINGYSENLIEAEGLEPKLRESAHIINKAGTKAANLTRQLLSFSRKSLMQKQVFNLNTTVTNVVGLLEGVLGKNIQLSAKLEPALKPVNLDPEQMEQVLMNLAINARDAMTNGGTLTIETSNVVLQDTLITQQGEAPPGAYVVISVSDNGTGISPAVLERVFEPFFTTKDIGKGSGLGLSMVLGIVQQSGGVMQAISELGKGSCFKIYCAVYEEN